MFILGGKSGQMLNPKVITLHKNIEIAIFSLNYYSEHILAKL